MEFVQRLVMQTIFDVHERQARSALLPDAVISTIQNQLTVTVTYAPLMCSKDRLSLVDPTVLEMMESAGIIIANTVTALCSDMGRRIACNVPTPEFDDMRMPLSQSTEFPPVIRQ
ncbi:hypothetical protein KIN20_006848 [Parelaphostrongylus tenuis]|uniref:Uncharacterized protein n=1 Tax=Parelaphostrongylus tenuis TaxID=148309 RepID=A0AAD5MN64_PARTN|nr:hypothetical protein KIN20_006848 [Parelaphostrongylus tenuis]